MRTPPLRLLRFRALQILALLAAIAVSLTVLHSPPVAADPMPTGDRVVDRSAIAHAVQEFARNAGYPGVAIAVTHGDRIVDLAGYGRSSDGTAVTPTTPMPVESVSKAFTAMAVMQLVEEGRFELDTPVHRLVPDFAVDDPRGTLITVRELLNQTSGITDRTLPLMRLPQPFSPAGAVERAHQAGLAGAPGTKYSYTNTNFDLAARIVEVVSGERFTDYLRRHVFAPARMTDTSSIERTPDDLPADLVHGHLFAYGVAVPAIEPTRFVAGSAGVISTAADLAQWLIIQQNGGRSGTGRTLVSRRGITAMHTPAPGRDYALGWEQHDGVVRHEGISMTYTSSVVLLPSGYGIAVLGNSGFGLANEGAGRLADDIAVVLAGQQPTDHPPLRLIVDLVLAAGTIVTVLLGIRRWRRNSSWVDKYGNRVARDMTGDVGSARSRIWAPMSVVLRLVPRLAPLVLLLLLPDLVGFYAGGKDANLTQLLYFAPALVIWIVIAAGLNLSTIVTRVVMIMRRRRPSTITRPGSVGPHDR